VCACVCWFVHVRPGMILMATDPNPNPNNSHRSNGGGHTPFHFGPQAESYLGMLASRAASPCNMLAVFTPAASHSPKG
jgi:hypothetical protein